ncbi:MAG: hypothetical protein SGJ18_04965 [Pseudomonadota bacterium]|nr:hypothetical protein [Pseudomonadota bacterium]
MSKIIFLVVLWSGSVIADDTSPKIKCDVDELTRNCALFYENTKNKFCFSDGGCLPNSFWGEPQHSESAVDSFPEGGGLVKQWGTKEEFEDKQKLAQLLESKDKVTEWFRFELANRLWEIGMILHKENENQVVNLPWPPGSENQEQSFQKAGEVNRFLEKAYSAETISEISKLAKKYYIKSIQSEVKQENPESLKFLPKSTPMNTARLGIILERVKSYYREEILQGRNETDLSSEERLAIARISSVKLKIESIDEDQCANPTRARFNPLSYSIILCGGYLEAPADALYRVLGHELQHVNDPCKSLFPVYRINKEKLKMMNISIIENSKTSDEYKKVWTQYFTRLNELEITMFSEFYENDLGGSIKSNMAKTGAIEILHPNIDEKKNPFSEVNKCLAEVGATSGAWKDPDNREVEKMVAAYSDNFAQLYGLRPEDESVKKITAILKKYKKCVPISGINSKSGEVSGDWMASKISGRALNNWELKSPNDKIAPIFIQAKSHCSQKKNIPLPKTVEDQLKLALTFWSTEDEHPQPRSRANLVTLAEPNIQKAIGCTPLPNQRSCNYLEPVSPQKSNPESSGGKTK